MIAEELAAAADLAGVQEDERMAAQRDPLDGQGIEGWPGLKGKFRAELKVGLESWVAHDAGLFHHWITLEGPEDTRTTAWHEDLILWHDVRDVEVSRKTLSFRRSIGPDEVHLLVQYPRIDVTRARSDLAFMRFCLEVARLTSEAHR
jgi:hypothetical protein